MVIVGAASPFIPVGRASIERSIARLFGVKDAALVETNLRAFAAGQAAGAEDASGGSSSEG